MKRRSRVEPGMQRQNKKASSPRLFGFLSEKLLLHLVHELRQHRLIVGCFVLVDNSFCRHLIQKFRRLLQFNQRLFFVSGSPNSFYCCLHTGLQSRVSHFSSLRSPGSFQCGRMLCHLLSSRIKCISNFSGCQSIEKVNESQSDCILPFFRSVGIFVPTPSSYFPRIEYYHVLSEEGCFAGG